MVVQDGRGNKRRSRGAESLVLKETQSDHHTDIMPSRIVPVSHGTILIVEDDAPVRGLFVRALTGAGYRVLEARNGEEAIKMFADHGAPIMPRAGR